jgi:hypothetical protein
MALQIGAVAPDFEAETTDGRSSSMTGSATAGRFCSQGGSVTDDEARTIYPQGWKSPKPYIRIVPQPK